MENIRLTFLFGWPYIKKYAGRLTIGILFGGLFGLFNASFVWGSKTLFERLEAPSSALEETAITNESMTSLDAKISSINHKVLIHVDEWLPKMGDELTKRQLLGGIFFLPILILSRGVLGYLSVYFLGWVSEHAVRDIRMDTHKKLQSLSMDFFTNRQLGDFTMLMNRSTQSLHRCLTYGIADSVREPFAIIGLVTALFILDWELALFGILFAPLSAIPIVIIGRKLRRVAATVYNKGTEQDSLLVEVYSNMRTIKAYCLERLQKNRFRNIYGKLVRAGMQSLQARHLQNPVIEVLSVLGVGVIIIFVFYSGKSVPQLVGFLTGTIMLYQPIRKLGVINQYYQEASVGVEMLQNVFNVDPTVKEANDSSNLETFERELLFKEVEFSYGDKAVLTDFNLRLTKGMKLGVVGESGAGKSTVVSLLLRFYDPTKGRVTIDGADIRGVTFESLRGQMALVSQEVVIFDQTVAENIACGKLDASREEIVAAAKAANAHEFIEGLPEGYDTRLGEQGTRLSGGQRQRIAIARAFVRQAPILILDEATAALDSKAESEVQGAIDRLEEGRTVVCVAHRLSTLRGMDQIIVLEEGRVVEEGGFLELLERDGIFAEMARKQGLTAG